MMNYRFMNKCKVLLYMTLHANPEEIQGQHSNFNFNIYLHKNYIKGEHKTYKTHGDFKQSTQMTHISPFSKHKIHLTSPFLLYDLRFSIYKVSKYSWKMN